MTSYLKFFSVPQGTMKITLDDNCNVVRAGSSIVGKVEIELENEMGGEELKLTFKGQELAMRKRGPVTVSGSKDICSIEQTIPDLIKKKLKPGKVACPFSFEIPDSLPSSSMHFVRSVGDAGFQLHYKLTAQFGKIVGIIPVSVAAAPINRDTKTLTIHPNAKTIKSTKRRLGNVIVAATVKDTNVVKGGTIRLSLSCRNDSLATIQRVKVKLVELINWGCQEGYDKSRSFKETLLKIDAMNLPGVQTKSKNRSELVDVTYRNVKTQTALYEDMYRDMTLEHNILDLTCPIVARDSYYGSLIDIRHYVKVQFITDGHGSNPSIKVPITVGLPQVIPQKAQELQKVMSLKHNMSSSLEMLPVIPKSEDELPIALPVPLPLQKLSQSKKSIAQMPANDTNKLVPMKLSY